MRNKIYVYYPPREITKRYKIPTPPFFKKKRIKFFYERREEHNETWERLIGAHTHMVFTIKKEEIKRCFFKKRKS